jgi:hypothetical protein
MDTFRGAFIVLGLFVLSIILILPRPSWQALKRFSLWVYDKLRGAVAAAAARPSKQPVPPASKHAGTVPGRPQAGGKPVIPSLLTEKPYNDLSLAGSAWRTLPKKRRR